MVHSLPRASAFTNTGITRSKRSTRGTWGRRKASSCWPCRRRSGIPVMRRRRGAFSGHMSYKLRAVFTSAVLSWMLLAALQANSTFIPDSVFKGSNLTGWHVLGQAYWQAQNGELVGTVKEGGGWLVLDQSYQDVALHTLFKCTGGCKTGVLFRAEKTAEGMKGVFVSIADGQSDL